MELTPLPVTAVDDAAALCEWLALKVDHAPGHPDDHGGPTGSHLRAAARELRAAGGIPAPHDTAASMAVMETAMRSYYSVRSPSSGACVGLLPAMLFLAVQVRQIRDIRAGWLRRTVTGERPVTAKDADFLIALGSLDTTHWSRYELAIDLYAPDRFDIIVNGAGRWEKVSVDAWQSPDVATWQDRDGTTQSITVSRPVPAGISTDQVLIRPAARAPRTSPAR